MKGAGQERCNPSLPGNGPAQKTLAGNDGPSGGRGREGTRPPSYQ